MPPTAIQPTGPYGRRRKAAKQAAALVAELRALRAETADRARWDNHSPAARQELQRQINHALLLAAEAVILNLTRD